MKKIFIMLAAILLVPSMASTAVTTEEAPETTTAVQTTEAASVVDLAQFTATDGSTLGAVAATIVTSPADGGRAQAALAQAMERARAFAIEVPSLEERLNTLARGERMELSPNAFEFVSKAKNLAAQTHGWYDPTAPSPSSIFLKKDWRRIGLDASSRTLWLKSDGMTFDLTRLAQGFAADIMIEEIAESGFADAMVEVGGVQRNRGHDIFTPWNVTIGFGEGPTQTGTYRAYRYNIKDVAAATVTPEGLGRDLIDAHSRKPVGANSVRSVTVFAHDAATATAFAIAAYTLGPKHGLRYIEANPEMMCVIVDGDGTLYASKNMNITDAAERTAVRQGTKGGGTDDLRQKQREESMEQ